VLAREGASFEAIEAKERLSIGLEWTSRLEPQCATTRAPKDSDYKCDPGRARCFGFLLQFASIYFHLFPSY
jgi:hypothetical protein